jgi:hypothetical protein
MQFQAIETRLLPTDRRKIPLLWEVTATTAYIIDPPHPVMPRLGRCLLLLGALKEEIRS